MDGATDVGVVSTGGGNVLGQLGQRHAHRQHHDEAESERQRNGLPGVLRDQLKGEDYPGAGRDVRDRLHDDRGQPERTGPQV